MLQNELSEASKISNKLDKENMQITNNSKPTSQEIMKKPESNSNITNPDPSTEVLSEAEFNTIRDKFLEQINESVITEMETTAKRASQFAAEEMKAEVKEEVKDDEVKDVVEPEDVKESSEVVEKEAEQEETKGQEEKEEEIAEFKEDTKNGYTS